MLKGLRQRCWKAVVVVVDRARVVRKIEVGRSFMILLFLFAKFA